MKKLLSLFCLLPVLCSAQSVSPGNISLPNGNVIVGNGAGAGAALALGTGVATALGVQVNAAGGFPTFTTFPTQYLFSVLNDNVTTGPQTYVSTDALTMNSVTKNGTTIYSAAAFRDPRVKKIGNTYYLSYTPSSFAGNTGIGLAVSSDLVNWTTVTTPNWTSLFLSGQNGVANGCWFGPDGSGNYWMYFATAPASFTTNVTPWVVQFNPNGASSTFGTPSQITLGSTRTYADFMNVWNSGGTYYALLQSSGTFTSVNTNQAFVELLSNSSPTSGSWTVTGVMNFAGWGSTIEAGSQVLLPNGNTRVYFDDWGGGKIYFSDSAGANYAGTWTSPTAIGNFSASGSPFIKADWVDVVPFNDTQTDQNLNALQHSGGIISSSGGVTSVGNALLSPTITGSLTLASGATVTGSVTLNNASSANFPQCYTAVYPNLPTSGGSGGFLSIQIGTALSTGNAAVFAFGNSGNANAQNGAFLGLNGEPGLVVYKSGHVGLGVSSDNLTDLLQIAGTGSFTGTIKIAALTASTLVGTDASKNLASKTAGTDYSGPITMTANQTATITFNTLGNTETQYNTSATLQAAATIALPANSASGQILRYVTAGVITTVTVTGTVDGSLPALTTLAAGTAVSYQAESTSTGSARWIRFQ